MDLSGGSVVKNPPAEAGDAASVPGSGRPPGGGNDTPLQDSCLENPIERGALWATVHVDCESQLDCELPEAEIIVWTFF